ncbi:polysaccharide biosynthesis C-terminal domain-containing protein [Flagellimonas sp. CMM7]|uniref:polysaccharide biosynthesis C-terminal domain-containing protein n=1 Tax=Flagellimonas sp. CMM7 TaxID=2654676 RepID=UPI0013D675D0|nr:polysaccharide biosynthesis C-terminal domain-containing protein [Flagellimonas sp. CMM7]UII79748.1 polysaccharide biosynthesis C-terminal domain-containing protein [Flagellimonas sp. CMM7]
MGIVLKQSLKNITITYLGFAFGAINTLFLYIKILPDQYYGLVTFILASGAILMPLMAFGVHNTMVKFYSNYQDSEKDSFLTLMLLTPLLGILPLAIFTFLFQEQLGVMISQVNPMVKDYVWYIFLVALSMGYFEVFYSWCKVHLKSVFGNFMKEVFGRIGVSFLLLLLYFDVISLDLFFKCLVGLYLLRTGIIKLYAYSIRFPKFNLNFPSNTKEILVYTFLIILGGSAALILLEIDKVMLNQFIKIENVAYYGVAVYIATVIIVPSRAMHQITYPLTAELLNSGNHFALETLYKKTSLTLFIASGILFVLIVLNLDQLYKLLPESYRNGFTIVFLIGLAKVFDSMLGNNNSILFNSKYYKTVLVFGICLALVTIVLNLILIPRLGLEGAALASFISIFIFNLVKLVFVKLKFGFLPFTRATFKVFTTLILLGILFHLLQFSFHPIINIILKSALIVLMYLGILYRFEISEDVSGILSKWLKRKTP